MTDQDWLAGQLLGPMIAFLRGKSLERKWRLFAVACCRRVWSLVPDVRSRRAIESAEQFADGLIESGVIDSIYPDALAAFQNVCRQRTGERDLFHPIWRAMITLRRSALAAVRWSCLAAWTTAEKAANAAKTAEAVANRKDMIPMCDLLREVTGNPFRPASIGANCITPAVLGLARAAYAERRLPEGTLDANRLAVLADALEDAGCTETPILDHLRSEGPHVRGCWAPDLLLGKNQPITCPSPA